MYKITVPEPVALLEPVTDEPFKEPPVTFRRFVVNALLDDERFKKDFDAIEAALAISQALKVFHKPGAALLLEDDQIKRLRDVIATPGPRGIGASWHASVLPQLIGFLRAIKDADKEDTKSANGKAAQVEA
jgi:hypothetical protein